MTPSATTEITSGPMTARASHASRQPRVSISHCVIGAKMKMPIGVPRKAIDIARPRFRTNQRESGTLL